MQFIDGRDVFRLADTHGVPLTDVVQLAASRGARVQWLFYLAAAAEAGWTPRAVATRIREAAIDCTVESERAHGLRVVEALERGLAL